MSSSRGSSGLTKAALMSELATSTELPKKTIVDVFDALTALVYAEVKAGRAVEIPGLVKLKLHRKPASAARPGRNPATGETIMIKAKPACNVPKAQLKKAFKDAVLGKK